MFKTVVYICAYRTDANSPQEERSFNSKQAADDYARTVILLGGVAVVIKTETLISP